MRNTTPRIVRLHLLSVALAALMTTGLMGGIGALAVSACDTGAATQMAAAPVARHA